MKLRVQVVTPLAIIALHHLGCASCAAQTVVGVGTCEELQQAVAFTASHGDTSVALAPGGVSCDEWTTFEIENNKLQLVAQEGGSLEKHHLHAFKNVRFLVSSGVLQSDVALSFTTGGADTKTQEVNGGFLHVGQGAYASFKSAVFMKGVSVESVPRGWFDVTSEKGFGGCIYNQGSVRFAEYLEASGCATRGGGGSVPGNGGGVFNGKTGNIVFKGRVNISDCGSTNEKGNQGGAIYNEGKIWVFKTAKFFNNAATAGGAIFNQGDMSFVKKTAFFVGNRSYGEGDCYSGKDGRDFSGGQVLNTGSMTFDAGVVFEDGRTEAFGGAIGNYGSVIIKTSALFKRNSAGCMGGAISSPSNVTFELLEDARFQANTVAYDEAMCENWFERDSTSYVPNQMSFRCRRDMFD